MLRDLFSLFPAYAGVIPQNWDVDNIKTSFPRIRGGDPLHVPIQESAAAFSPHTRG